MATGLNFSRVAAGAPVSNVVAGPSANQGTKRAPKLDANGKPFPETELYLNAITKVMMQMEDGSSEMVEISLPFGIGIDTMGASANGGPMLNAAKDAFLSLFKQVGEGLAPGQTCDINEDTFPLTVTLQLRRKGNAHVSTDSNPLLAAMQAKVNGFGKVA